MSSTPGMNGAGLLKCTPRKRSGRSTCFASSVIEIVDVFEPMIASGFAALMRASVSPLTSMVS